MSDARATLHGQIERTLRDEIVAGSVAIGELLPSEHELCARFGTSRHTVREALRTLASEGLVERRQGAGTRVVSRAARGFSVQSMRSLDDLRQYAAETVLLIHTVRQVTLSHALAPVLRAEAGSRWLNIEGVRRAGDELISATQVFVHRRFLPLLGDIRVGTPLTGTIYNRVADRGGEAIAGAEQEIAARPMPRGVASGLGLASGAPALLFVRRYLDAAEGVMVCSLNWHPADRFVYSMRLQREG